MAKQRKKPDEVTARQLLNWITKNVARLTYNTGDRSVTVVGGHGMTHAKTRDPKAIEDAIRRARRLDIKERAALRRDKREGVYPFIPYPDNLHP